MSGYIQSGYYKFSNSSILYEYPCEDTTSCHGYEIKLHKGYWKIEVWGASGGNSYNTAINKAFNGGLGGYSIGVIYLERETPLFITIGGKGLSNYTIRGEFPGGFNGGGNGHVGYNGYYGASGGGSTDVRMGGIEVSQRIIVAGGGGGAGASNSNLDIGNFGGCGGGKEGLEGGGGINKYDSRGGKGGTQKSGGYSGYNNDALDQHGENGTLLYGGNGGNTVSGYTSSSGGGGGGYYGGGGGSAAGGGGGSGYIDGVKSGYGIIAKTLSGEETFPSPFGGYETGHLGNGFVRVKYIDVKLYSLLHKKNTSFGLSLSFIIIALFSV